MPDFITLPPALTFMSWPWQQMEPYYQALADRPLDSSTVSSWLADWSRMRELIDETYSRLQLANTQNTADEAAEQRYLTFIEQVYPKAQAADQKLKEKLLASGLEPVGFEIPLKNMRSEADLFSQENLPLFTQEQKIGSEYNKIIGAQTVEWEGEELTLTQLRARAVVPERDIRSKAWKLASARQVADRDKINDLWVKAMGVRKQIAANAGKSSFRAFKWQQLLRFDYTPDDSQRFHAAIEEVAVPAATRIYEKARLALGLDSTRPWDLDVDLYPVNLPAMSAYRSADELKEHAAAVFHKVSTRVGDYFEIMRRQDLLDLENRKGKAPGAFCTSFATLKVPFVFMNGVGRAEDVRTMFHECGHAFHVFERSHLPYHHQWRTNMEFNEVASMSMEFLTLPYITKAEGGFFDAPDASRARVQQLERALLFWPYMAVVDGFNHWVYENHDLASDPAACDKKWGQLYARFLPAQDWTGLEVEKFTGWHRKLHIHRYPFYYIEYGLAQLGAVQVWANALKNRESAVEMYLKSLSLGGTVSLPELYQAAGAKLAFDAATLKEAVDLLEEKIAEYSA